MKDFTQPWGDYDYVAFDTETSGAYPLGDDIVEFGAVRWRKGEVIDRYQTLLRPRQPMSAFNMGIHGITNEMVETAPLMKEKISEIRNFFDGAVLLAHHAPFDLGFVAVDFERHKVSFPETPVICTSLLSRKMIPETVNHKLQTLVKELKLEGGAAHRAADDAYACLQVALRCFERKADGQLQDFLSLQGKELKWANYSIFSDDPIFHKIREAIEENLALDMIYEGGSMSSETRRIKPIGIVRNPDGDYIMAKCFRDATNKRFYLSKIKDLAVAY